MRNTLALGLVVVVGACVSSPSIRAGTEPVTVIVDVTLKPEDPDEFLELIEASQPIFAAQSGFISSSVHRST